MKKLLASVVAVGLAFAVGCENKSPPGGPGATIDNKNADRSMTFKVNPPGHVTLKQGEQKEARIAIDRGKNFKEDVTLTFDAPKGIEVKPRSITIKAGDKETAVQVHADKDAPLGNKNPVTVKATPTKGEPTSVNMDVKVEAGHAP
jgi:uncharacterized membrane protein